VLTGFWMGIILVFLILSNVMGHIFNRKELSFPYLEDKSQIYYLIKNEI